MKKTPLKRGTKQMKRTPLKKTGWKKNPLTKKKSKRRTGANQRRKKEAKKRKVKRLSPILGINMNAKEATYKTFRGMRYSGLKGVAWKICSLYIRNRDGYKCSTCNETERLAMQAGHYQPMGLVGNNNKLGWDEMNIHCQCMRCNEHYGGLQEVMGNYIRSKYGEKVRAGLEKRVGKVDPVENWEEMILYYENKLSKL